MYLKRLISRGILPTDLHHKTLAIVINLPQSLLNMNFYRASLGCWDLCSFTGCWSAFSKTSDLGTFSGVKKKTYFYFLLRLEGFRDHRWVFLSSQVNFIASETRFNCSNIWLKQNPI